MATLDFKGKALVQNYHLTVKYHELVPKKDKSLTDKVRLDDNLIIHGDNLKALKALLPTYAGRVKCIYIDPPYNTGNEGWAYNDNVNSPMIQDWLGKAVDRDDLTRHDKWLCMMTPRLKLLKELLRDDGVIFVSIDDNEAHRLCCLMDEMFGEENFVSTIIWEKADSPRMDVEYFSSRHDSVIAFARNRSVFQVNREFYDDENLPTHYDKIDEDERAYYLKPLRAMGGQGETREARPNLYFALVSPSSKKVFPHLQDGTDGAWRWGREKIEKEKKRIEWREGSDGWTPYFRIYADMSKGVPPETIFHHEEVGSSRTSRKQFKEVFPDGPTFDTPKPLGLLAKLLQIATDKDSIILDSFGGSGTTAHAVLAQNKEDGGNRKFILVECEDYADTITAERVRRVIKGVKGASDESLKKGLGGSFSYFELGKAIELESILDGKNLPGYLELARYVFYTATGEEFDERKMNEKRQFVGESKTHEVFLFYKPDIDYLKKIALTLDRAEDLGKPKGKRRLVFAPTKYLDQEQLDALRIDFAQLPFEIYKLAQ
ncbi:MAG: site-specific DNA-methyltransferase [Verrucomicrobiota bacterium]